MPFDWFPLLDRIFIKIRFQRNIHILIYMQLTFPSACHAPNLAYSQLTFFFLFIMHFHIPSSCTLPPPTSVRYFPKVIYPNDNFSRVFFQMATSQMFNFTSGNCPKVRPSGKLHNWEVATWEITLGIVSNIHMSTFHMYFTTSPLLIMQETK